MADLILDKEYSDWIKSLSNKYKIAQIKAASEVNKELLLFYWELGKEITEKQQENKYGSGFFKSLSMDLKSAIPDAKCFSVKNLYYIRKFYLMYSEIFPQVGGKSKDSFLPQVGTKSKDPNFPQLGGKSNDSNFPQLGGILFSVPWGHHKTLIDKYFGSPDIALFYIVETVKNGWSRDMLLNMLDTDLHKRQGKAISNFQERLPKPQSELVQDLTKDPYIFDFTNMVGAYKERELKEALLKEITKFLLELGEGFAYVGKEYRLEVGDTEQFTDLLFYNLKLRCYVVIEVKTGKLKGGDLGQLGLYVTSVNHLLKTDQDNPTIGLLICKTKDNILAQYSLEGYNLPIGISQYQLEKHLPKDFKSTLPTIEEIEAKLNLYLDTDSKEDTP